MITRTLKCVMLFLLGATVVVGAQETRGTISGTVLDAQGTSVPGATVTVLNLDTNVSNVVTTNGSGYYGASLLLPGNYRVTVELQGFKTAVRNGIILSVGQQVDVKMSLEVGAVSESVTVTGQATDAGHQRRDDRPEPGSPKRGKPSDVREHAGAADPVCRRGERLVRIRPTSRRASSIERRRIPRRPAAWAATSGRSTARPTTAATDGWRLRRIPT